MVCLGLIGHKPPPTAEKSRESRIAQPACSEFFCTPLLRHAQITTPRRGREQGGGGFDMEGAGGRLVGASLKDAGRKGFAAARKRPRAAFVQKMTRSGGLATQGLHLPQGEYPNPASSSRVAVFSALFFSLMSAADGQSGRWNLRVFVLSA